MVRFLFFFVFFLAQKAVTAQRTISRTEAIELSLANQRNLRAATLTVQQQQQLLKTANDIQSPQVFGESTPYEPLVLGIQQTLSLPSVYRNRRLLQGERIRLAQLQLQGSQMELKREVGFSYLQLQYLEEKIKLLLYQDSIYQEIKRSSMRFFEAGQINKLEELQATTQADQVRNALQRTRADLVAELEIFRFYTNLSDSIQAEPMQPYVFLKSADTAITNVQLQILSQNITVTEKQLKAERSELLPQVQAGVSFPTTGNYEKPIGYQFGITIPIWRRQNRSRIAAAETGIEIARSQQELEQLRLQAQFRQAIANYAKERQSLDYFNGVALPQSRSIIETSQRLFQGGELNYIESLRNLQTAFEIFFNHIDTQRAYNEAVIQLNYLNGTL